MAGKYSLMLQGQGLKEFKFNKQKCNTFRENIEMLDPISNTQKGIIYKSISFRI